jgi:putative transcriptional regulator
MKNHLRILRAQREWSQAELAKRLRVSRQTVNAIETGKYDPSLSLAFRIAEIFEQPIEAIFLREAPAAERKRSITRKTLKWIRGGASG